ncbi:MAG: class I SAM-dependent methyltransferase [Candidatus Diapherotrites archaeon]
MIDLFQTIGKTKAQLENWPLDKEFQLFRRKNSEKAMIQEMIGSVVRKRFWKRAVEIGGNFLCAYSSQVGKICIVEKDKVRAKTFQKTAPQNAEIVNSSWQRFFPNKHYDLAVLAHSVCYFHPNNRKRQLEKLFSCMRKGGKILIVTNALSGDYLSLKHFFYSKNNWNGFLRNNTFLYILNFFVEKPVSISVSQFRATIKAKDGEEMLKKLEFLFGYERQHYALRRKQILKFLRQNQMDTRFSLDNSIFVIQKNV